VARGPKHTHASEARTGTVERDVKLYFVLLNQLTVHAQ
jgi:hypothetical protein